VPSLPVNDQDKIALVSAVESGFMSNVQAARFAGVTPRVVRDWRRKFVLDRRPGRLRGDRS